LKVAQPPLGWFLMSSEDRKAKGSVYDPLAWAYGMGYSLAFGWGANAGPRERAGLFFAMVGFPLPATAALCWYIETVVPLTHEFAIFIGSILAISAIGFWWLDMRKSGIAGYQRFQTQSDLVQLAIGCVYVAVCGVTWTFAISMMHQARLADLTRCGDYAC
jgi:hypothetical protein